MLPGFLGDKWGIVDRTCQNRGKTISKEREWLPFLFRRHFFFPFYVLHVDAGEKSPSMQEIETRNSSKK